MTTLHYNAFQCFIVTEMKTHGNKADLICPIIFLYLISGGLTLSNVFLFQLILSGTVALRAAIYHNITAVSALISTITLLQ